MPHTADHALAWCGLQPNLNFTEKDIELRLNGRRITFIRDRKLGTIIAIDDAPCCGIPHVVPRRGFRKVEGCITDAQRSVAGTIGLIQRVAARPGLRSRKGGNSEQEGQIEKDRHGCCE